MVLRVDPENLETVFTVIGELCGGLPNPKEWAKWVRSGQLKWDRSLTIYKQYLGDIQSPDIRNYWENELTQHGTQSNLFGNEYLPKLSMGSMAKWSMDKFGNLLVISIQDDQRESFTVQPLNQADQVGYRGKYYVFSNFQTLDKVNSMLQRLQDSNVTVSINFECDVSNYAASSIKWLTVSETLDL
jgi:hypothetical protein